MTQRKYDKATAQAIMQWAYSDYQDDQNKPYEVRDDGVYVNDVFREFCPPGTIYDWTPADCMDGPESPNPDTAPALPIPFTAADLAACMLDGIGQTIWQSVGVYIGSSIDESLLANFHPRMRWMRDALREAYALAAEAQNIVGELDHAEQQSAHDLRARYSDAYDQAIERDRVMERVVVGTKKDGSPEYGGFIPRDEYLRRLERAKASVSDLKAQADSANAQADEKHRTWREAMVRQLLKPEQPIAKTAPETESANNVPVVACIPDDGGAWKVKARDRANDIIKRQQERDLHPSQEILADEIARAFRGVGIVGADGKPLSGAYIKRHALKGISSAKGRQLSTSTRRSK